MITIPLIWVRHASTGKQLILNAAQVSHIYESERGNPVQIKMANGDIHNVGESLNQVLQQIPVEAT